ncbi:MAG: isoprenylcysteine carboxylmethyltransferase family protein [Chloroflexota bacterium]|nr:MAG: isoprenylcysteine carboxylmethyltransferase family protein [Chloroflexota bacterium]
MDPEIYVFPNIKSAPLKILASTLLFGVVLVVMGLLLPRLPGPRLWASVDRSLSIGPLNVQWAHILSIALGYALFIYWSYQAWLATHQKNTVEDPTLHRPTCLLETGFYARARHPMYGMFILANAGLGLAMNSVYGLAFGLLSLGLFVLNGIFEERAALIRMFGEQYQAYMQRVRRRYFTPAQAVSLVLILALNMLGVVLG